MSKLRVLYILSHFPQISETYIRSELEALAEECEIRIISLSTADYPYKNHAPFRLLDDVGKIEKTIEEFRPDVLHTHWLQQTRVLAYFAGYFDDGPRRRQVPFTVRSHSFDVLDHEGQFIQDSRPLVNSDLCLGILAFPFVRPILEKAGIRPEKIHDCFPVINYRRFYDPAPNGDAVINVGACLPKKQMEDYIKLACAVPDMRFNLYALGYQTREMVRRNTECGNRVHIIPPVEPEHMPAEYKKHRWLVYTADREMNSVGWPMAVAEAQAAGVGVCLPNIRPDLREYAGAAGFLYNSIEEVAEVVRQPLSDELRQQGFEQANKSDVFEHKHLLTDLWQKVRMPTTTTSTLFSNNSDRAKPWGTGSSLLESKERLRQASAELIGLIPAGSTFLLLDDNSLGQNLAPGRRALPFLEHEGQYWGPPQDDGVAIAEMERLRHTGASFIAFAWPAFWWLSHYTGFLEHLRSRFCCVVENDRLVVFDLRVQH